MMNPEIAKTSKICTVCNVIVTGDASWQAHIQGRRHQQATSRNDDRYEKSQRSIYVGNLPPGTNETILFNYFMRYADVTEVILDKNQGKFAIIEFSSADSIEYVLQQKHFLSDRRLMVQRRKLKPETPKGPPRKEVLRAEEARSNEQQADQVYNQLVLSGNVAEQMDDLVNILKLSNQDTEYRARFIQELTQVLRRYFVYSEVHVYGSSANGLGQVGCDLDILVSLRPESDEYFQVEDNDNNQKTAKQLFQNAGRGYKITPEHLCDLSIKDVTFLLKLILSKVPHCQNILLIPSKRCPIVRLAHVELGISCDVSVKHRLCLYNTNLIRLLTQLDRRALLLFFAIKYWAKFHEIGGGGGVRLSSYSVVMLMIFYLQNTVPQLLPTIGELRALEGQPRIIAGWDCNFCSAPNRIPVTENRLTVDVLLKNFFRFYVDFDFATYAVCPRIGKKFFPKSELVRLIPNVMEKPLCVQDPFELSHNLTGNVSDKVVSLFMEGIRRGNAWANSTRNIWTSTRDGSNWGILCLFERFPPPTVQSVAESTRSGQQVFSQAAKPGQPTPLRPSQQSSYWASQRPGEQANIQPPTGHPTSSTFWSTANRSEASLIQQPMAAAKGQPTPAAKGQPTPPAKGQPTPPAKGQPKPAAKAQPTPAAKAQPTPAAKTQPTPVTKTLPTPAAKTQPTPAAKTHAIPTTLKITPSPVAQTGIQKTPGGSSVHPEDGKLTSQPAENTTILPSPIRAWPPITTAVIQQTTKRKRKSKLQVPQQWNAEDNLSSFVVTTSKTSAEKHVGASQNTWNSIAPEMKEKWIKQVFQVVHATFSAVLQMPCSELEVTKDPVNNTSNTDGGSSPKRLKKDNGSSSDSGVLTASFVCSVYHRTWERRRHFKQRLVPTAPQKPFMEVEEKISMLIIESLASTPEKPLFSFKCRVESTEDLCQFKVSMIPMAYSSEFVGVAVDFYKSFVPKAIMKSL